MEKVIIVIKHFEKMKIIVTNFSVVPGRLVSNISFL